MKNQTIYLGLGVGIVATLLFIAVIFSYRYRSTDLTGNVIADDVQKLAKIFDAIHEQCGIISFDYQQNPINFLNVKSFTSSEIGPMNLSYADKWNGPYLEDNLAVQGKEYMVVRTQKGYFITPGEGVKLPNGFIIGKDIVLNESADIEAMMRNPQKLLFKERSLAARLNLSASP